MSNARATLLLLVSSFVIGHSSFAADEIDAAQPLRFGSFTLYSENDKYFVGTDENYTNGLKLSALSTDLRDQLRFLDGLVGGDHPRKLGLSLGQNIYTPADTQTTALIPDDRPYAAWLYVGASFQVYRPAATEGGPARLDVFELTAGVVGPAALGREFQNGFHRIIGVEEAQGWDNQIKNEPGVNLVYERKYRLATARARDGWGADIIPHAGLSLGNIFTYANTGFEVRAGHALPADFGSNLIRASGDSNALVRPPLSAFLFAAVDARAVARDITLDGNTLRDSQSIDKKHFVADLYAGLGLGTRHWQLTYAQTYRTREFTGQDKRSVFGSLSLSFFY
jgi:hypothetical protein